jgi:hypothetical protein
MKIKGVIKFQKRVFVGEDECFGVTRANGDHFDIRISEQTSQNLDLYAETVIHELLHLAFNIVAASVKVHIPEKQQHRIINKVVPNTVSSLRRYVERRIK